jgi:hypothetical protein
MKGVIFNLLEDFITENWGEEAYEEILSMCPLHTKEPFLGPGTYPDADLMAIVTAACRKLGVAPADAIHAFGKYMFPKLAARFPVFLEGHSHPKTFLKTVNDVIHVEVKKLFRDAEPPLITWTDPGPDRLVLVYASRRKLCSLATGLLEGAAEHFKTPIHYAHTRCMLEGADACELELTFAAGEEAKAA